MTIRTDIRIHDNAVDGFDYELRCSVSGDTLTAWHGGQYAGQLIATNVGVWTVLAPVEWNNRIDDHTEIAWTTGNMGTAVELLHTYWSNQ